MKQLINKIYNKNHFYLLGNLSFQNTVLGLSPMAHIDNVCENAFLAKCIDCHFKKNICKEKAPLELLHADMIWTT